MAPYREQKRQPWDKHMIPSGIERVLQEKQYMDRSCDLCGISTGVRCTMHHEGFIWLCPRCNYRINHLPEKLDEITELFIIGNAL